MRQFSGYSGNVNSIAVDAGGFVYVTESSFTDSAVSVFAANSNGLSHSYVQCQYSRRATCAFPPTGWRGIDAMIVQRQERSPETSV